MDMAKHPPEELPLAESGSPVQAAGMDGRQRDLHAELFENLEAGLRQLPGGSGRAGKQLDPSGRTNPRLRHFGPPELRSCIV